MTEIELLNAKLTRADYNLVQTRAQTNRIRTEAQYDITHVIDCLNVILTDSRVDTQDWITAVISYLRYTHRKLDNLPRN